MRTSSTHLPRAGLILLLGFGSVTSFADSESVTRPAPRNLSPQPFGWDEVGAKAAAQYAGEGLSVTANETSAHLNCIFQKLRGEATREGLWLTSTVTNTANVRFRVTATAVGRATSEDGVAQ